MTMIEPRPGFQWALVQWGGPKQRRTKNCSYCGAGLADTDVPLILWKADGSAAEFCDHCKARWFGFEKFPDPPEYDES